MKGEMMASQATIYTSDACPYCEWAKRLLEKRNIEYKELRVDQDDEARKEMREKTRMTPVPQIYIGNRHIGGYQELVEYDQQQGLANLSEG